MIDRNVGKLVFLVFRNPTFTGLSIKFLSECFTQYKINSTKTVVHRVYSLLSSFLNPHKNKFSKKDFNDNGFNLNSFYKVVNNFLNSIFETKPKYNCP